MSEQQLPLSFHPVERKLLARIDVAAQRESVRERLVEVGPAELLRSIDYEVEAFNHYGALLLRREVDPKSAEDRAHVRAAAHAAGVLSSVADEIFQINKVLAAPDRKFAIVRSDLERLVSSFRRKLHDPKMFEWLNGKGRGLGLTGAIQINDDPFVGDLLRDGEELKQFAVGLKGNPRREIRKHPDLVQKWRDHERSIKMREDFEIADHLDADRDAAELVVIAILDELHDQPTRTLRHRFEEGLEVEDLNIRARNAILALGVLMFRHDHNVTGPDLLGERLASEHVTELERQANEARAFNHEHDLLAFQLDKADLRKAEPVLQRQLSAEADL